MDLQIDKSVVIDKLNQAGVPEVVRDQVADSVANTLQMSMTQRLEEQLSDEQLAEFEPLADGDDPSRAAEWIRQQFPDYDGMVLKELDAIIAELKESANQMVDSAS